jgi:hypothetical protein
MSVAIRLVPRIGPSEPFLILSLPVFFSGIWQKSDANRATLTAETDGTWCGTGAGFQRFYETFGGQVSKYFIS